MKSVDLIIMETDTECLLFGRFWSFTFENYLKMLVIIILLLASFSLESDWQQVSSDLQDFPK